MACVGRIALDDEKKKLINTLYITQQPNQDAPYRFEPGHTADLESIIKQDDKDTKNLVMCHGYGAGLGFFYRNYQQLSQVPGWRIFSIDWLGMGNSSRPKWTIARKSSQTWDDVVDTVEDHFVESLEDWRNKVGINKMTLCGHSMGGYFATCYALKYPERVEKLILVSPGTLIDIHPIISLFTFLCLAGIPIPPPEAVTKPNKNPQETVQQEADEIGAAYQAETAAVENIAKQQGVPNNKNPPRRIPAWATYLWNNNITPMSIIRMTGPFGARLVHNYTSRRFAHLTEAEQHDFYDYLYNITSSTGSGEFALAAILAPGAYARKPLFHRLAQLKMPTVFIYGEHDWMDYKAAEEAKEHMKVPAKVIRIANGGHHMYLENPKDFNRICCDEMSK
ncbi:alpha/beta-hydrolase [Rhizopus microsporus ATCC 52813]|uniref:Alpha/beta-hydrolase n=1 Tax=Rhizopus microsporus ATCC 52813 TaxID=1340429 RepID=A0A2G4SL30_RHIZD|nr:alpha/beta-hydrolase [Rhizopus microsporus ATCC 52813]PHZ09475.1 alpha/beta-hydrolase [Rhizopus microsporus ATCC 52813]